MLARGFPVRPAAAAAAAAPEQWRDCHGLGLAAGARAGRERPGPRRARTTQPEAGNLLGMAMAASTDSVMVARARTTRIRSGSCRDRLDDRAFCALRARRPLWRGVGLLSIVRRHTGQGGSIGGGRGCGKPQRRRLGQGRSAISPPPPLPSFCADEILQANGVIGNE